ncbi:MAG TPA: hypothetical protein DCY48_03565 [Candidatus Magasanikbacteria bacterium]|nr:MAG: hypothetical protein A3I74_04710 [Candidatus Magasanikbacteria bacterium RIFCSPLOWO2_02_FULL_47_16]OGH79507.1 MAG: hypothetical protein A3C10_01680 [Candidatus Magasanikbacteria bacterium RIFCSPHIGHO2_02_FULL_48_18]OGH81959.1 MAG: hypothetical protein A3G08_02010 [Candidatus Magasanikbacteria bacterium RIFCSPLOWO2_12_FULL_47_9b]HAZ28822.1 hypothetical protein [Candidatus Magasanikbacteria bacterium]
MPKVSKEPVERVTLKLPKSVATYLRKAFPHGRRSEFIAKCILEYKHNQEVSEIEQALKKLRT